MEKSVWLRVFLMGLVVLTALPSLIFAQAETPPTPNARTHPNTNPTFRVIDPRYEQTPQQQEIDQLECFESTSEQLGWDPYLAFEELVDLGYALALTREEQERGLVFLAVEGAMIGAVAGDLAGKPGRGAEVGAAISLATAIIHSNYLNETDDPQAQRAISRYEKKLRKWDRTYCHCLKTRGYRVPSP